MQDIQGLVMDQADQNTPAPKGPADLYELLEGDFDRAAEERAVRLFVENGWTEASLLDAYLQLRQQLRDRDGSQAVPSLESQSRRKIIEVLSDDADFNANFATIFETLKDRPQLTSLLVTQQMPYKLLRKLWPLLNMDTSIDEAVLRNDVYIKSTPHLDDATYLVTAEELIKLLESSSTVALREPPPGKGADIQDGGTPLLPTWVFSRANERASSGQQKHYSSEFFMIDSHGFSNLLNNLTGGLSSSMPWSNIVMAGPLATDLFLFEVDARGDSIDSGATRPAAFRLDLFMFGVSPEWADSRAQEIVRRYSSGNRPNTTIVRDSRCIVACSDTFPSIRIDLRLFKSHLDVLNSFTVDAMAIGFNGSKVTMLPRAARAIERGANAFTMNLVNDLQPTFRFKGPAYGPISSTHVTQTVQASGAYLDNQAVAQSLRDITEADSNLLEDKNGQPALTPSRLQRALAATSSIRLDAGSILDNISTYFPSQLGNLLDNVSDRTWHYFLRPEILSNLGTQYQPTSAFRGYLTRRVRHFVHSTHWGQQYDSRQLAEPIPISKSVETVLRDWADPKRLQMIPVYNSRYHGPSVAPDSAGGRNIPALRDSDDPEALNLRYWIVDNLAAWDGADPGTDDVFDILRCMVQRVKSGTQINDRRRFNRDGIRRALLKHVRNQLLAWTLPPDPLGPIYRGQLGKREGALFAAWIVQDLKRRHRDPDNEMDSASSEEEEIDVDSEV